MDSDDESEASVAHAEEDPRLRLFYVRLILILIFITSAGEEDIDQRHGRKRLRSQLGRLHMEGLNSNLNLTSNNSLAWEEDWEPPEPKDEVFLLKRFVDLIENKSGLEGDERAGVRAFPRNLSVIFNGSWELCGEEMAPIDEELPFHNYSNSSFIPTGFGGFNVGTFSTVEINPRLSPDDADFPLMQRRGRLKMNLGATPTVVPSISQVDGMVSAYPIGCVEHQLMLNKQKVSLFDGQDPSNNRDVLTVVSGYYLSSFGELSLVVNTGFHARRIALEFPKTDLELMNFSSDDLPANSFINRSNTVVWDNSRLLTPFGKSSRLARLSGAGENSKSGPMNNMCFFHFHLRAEPVIQPEKKDLQSSSRSTAARPRWIRFAGHAKSSNCHVTMKIEVSAIEYDVQRVLEKAWSFSMLMLCVCAMQISLCVMQLSHSDTQTEAAKASIGSVFMMAGLDALICALCLSSATFLEQVFKLFTGVALLKLILFAICQMRYILIIWKARNPEQFNRGWNTMRRELERLYCAFYGFIVGCAAIVMNFVSLRWLALFVAYSYFVPQILTNILRDTPDPFHPRFVFGMALSRLVVPLYVLGCPSSLVFALEPGEVHTYPVVCTLLVIYQAIQVAILYGQKVKGARFFVPKRFLPLKYDYFRPMPLSMYNSECVICMLPIAEGRDENTQHMITPCNHAFHERCLSHWLQIKEECPTCRARLPPA